VKVVCRIVLFIDVIERGEVRMCVANVRCECLECLAAQDAERRTENGEARTKNAPNLQIAPTIGNMARVSRFFFITMEHFQ